MSTSTVKVKEEVRPEKVHEKRCHTSLVRSDWLFSAGRLNRWVNDDFSTEGTTSTRGDRIDHGGGGDRPRLARGAISSASAFADTLVGGESNSGR